MKTKKRAEEYTSPAMDEIFKEISPGELNRTKQRMLLAAKIDDAIKAKGWKKTDFAHAMIKSPSEISKWLSGTHNFTTDTLSDIEEVLGIQLLNLGKKQEIHYSYSISVHGDLQTDFGIQGRVDTANLISDGAFLYQNSKFLSKADMTLKN